jgi:hypothetical protein
MAESKKVIIQKHFDKNLFKIIYDKLECLSLAGLSSLV